MSSFSNLLVSLCWLGCGSLVYGQSYTPGKPIVKDFQTLARPFIENYCLDCHGEVSPAAELSLAELGPVEPINADVWKSVWAQVRLREMPPADMPQPAAAERLRFSDWIVGKLSSALAEQGGFHSHRDPDKGNFLDHQLLFGELPSGIELTPTASPARLWRVTPEEHLTRLNELINAEPEFNPEKPGLRTHGDAVPTNHGGELKLYFGVDRIIKWQGGTVAYATAVKSVPSVLSSAKDHGLKNYPDFQTVNGAEATQVMAVAADIIRYMAYGPLSIAKPYQITDDPKSIADKMQGDLRGLPTSIVYSTKVVRPLTPVYEFFQDDQTTADRTALKAAVDFLFEALTFRPPTEQESADYVQIAEQSIDRLGKEEGAVLGLSAIFLDRDALFRPELVARGEADRDGRVMLQDWELGLAVNHALRYLRPDNALREAILDGRMRTRADVKREVERMLSDDSIRKPRVLQFFRDYFDHDLGGYICKDQRALADTGVTLRGQNYFRAMFDAAASTDRLIELALEEDQDVLHRLLTTQQIVVTKDDKWFYGTRRTPAGIAASKEAQRRAAAAAAEKEKAALAAWKKANPGKKPPKKKKKRPANVNHRVEPAELSGSKLFARVSRRSFGNGSMKPERTLATAPEGQRMGVLTQPSWLVSHSDAMDNHAIRRGRWIRERLLGGGIPDVPITVDAMLPDEPDSTLRDRMRVTREDYCWTCHKKMDPLGLPFEMYNHAGLYRTTELGQPVDTSGEVIESGDPNLDGEVADALELIERLASSRRAEQVFVRYAFRFWMGRNETLNDRPVLQEAHRAYRESGGSMKALLVSLLTSDAFLYRTREQAETVATR